MDDGHGLDDLTPSVAEAIRAELNRQGEAGNSTPEHLAKARATLPWTRIEAHDGSEDPVLVWNGERVGEAVLFSNFSHDGDDIEPERLWRWANDSCSCCWGNMAPKPTHFTPLPPPPERSDP